MISATLFTHLQTHIARPISEGAALYNTRFKYFGEYTKVVCFSRPLFNPHKLILHHKSKPIISQEQYFSKYPHFPIDAALILYKLFIAIQNADGETYADLMDSYKHMLADAEKEYRPKDSKDAAENESRSDSVKRAKDKVFEIAYANDFTHFITLTLDESKISRTNKSDIIKALNTWLKNNVARNGLKYVLIPEYHKDGKAIHFHGLISGNLKMTFSGRVSVQGRGRPCSEKAALKLGIPYKPIYNLDSWRYGFSTAVELDQNKEQVCLYICKYITKSSDKIIGRFYYSGGKDLIREVPTEYVNYPFSEFEATPQLVVPNCLSVKYKTL